MESVCPEADVCQMSTRPSRIRSTASFVIAVTAFTPIASRRNQPAPLADERVLRLHLPAIEVSGGSTERFELSPAIDDDRWITAWTFEPDARALVEEATVLVAPDAPLGSWTPLETT